mmetsp:Transcript_63681/g.170495  ORF Transcript_63681/g.170495 Transcript_63681/m.170495 type:complete len:87 (+) Transcript_63681:1039-1299(+)
MRGMQSSNTFAAGIAGGALLHLAMLPSSNDVCPSSSETLGGHWQVNLASRLEAMGKVRRDNGKRLQPAIHGPRIHPGHDGSLLQQT